MKKTLLYTTLGIAALGFSGCEKYLEKVPDNRSALNTPEKVTQVLVNAYPKAVYSAFCEAMTDNVADIGTGTARNQNADSYFWNNVDATNQDTPEYYWNACYKAISQANQALDAIGKAPDPENYIAQKGEALVARAYAHFMLATIFSKMYDAATADGDLGIPYVTEPETVVTKYYDRSTVKATWEKVEKDLLEGLPLIQDKLYTVPRFHFTKQAAYAFATRFFLYKKDYANAVKYADFVLPSAAWLDNMRPWLTTYQTAASSTEISTDMNSPTCKANLLLIQTTSWWARDYRGVRYATNANIATILKGLTGITKGIYAYRWYTWSSGLYNATPKYNENFIYSTASTGVGYVMFPALTIEEVLLNRAEAYVYLNNNEAALKDINTWVSGRIKSYSPATHNVTEESAMTYYNQPSVKDGLIKTLLDFRRIEFLHEGMRWFDIIRYDLPVTHRTITDQEFTLSAKDLRKVVQIPQEAISVGRLQPNPR